MWLWLNEYMKSVPIFFYVRAAVCQGEIILGFKQTTQQLPIDLIKMWAGAGQHVLLGKFF